MHECLHMQRNQLQYKVQAGSATFSTESLLLFQKYVDQVLQETCKGTKL